MKFATSPLVAALLLAACSPSKFATGIVADSLASGGGVMTSERDPEMVREALPFGLKTYESLLATVPEHRGLLTATARGYAAYAYLLQQHADFAAGRDEAASRELRGRAKLHFLRGRDYGLRALELRYPGFGEALRRDRAAALAQTGKDDVEALYWTGAAWAGALGVAKDDVALIADLPIAGALVMRILALDETFDRGGAYEFLISYEGARPGGDVEATRRYYDRALALSAGKRASVHLALAETITVREQDVAEFKRLIAAALAVDPEQDRDAVLVNAIAQRRARWLLQRLPELFVDPQKKA